MPKHTEPSADAQYIGDQLRAGLVSIAERLGGSRDPENVSMSTKMVADALEDIAGQLTNLVQAVDGISIGNAGERRTQK